MATLNLIDVKKSYGKDEVIHGVTFDIHDKEFVVIVGPSGCGKSTLLRMMAGLETITEGEIKIKDRRVNELEPMERNIAMVFQNYALYPHMSVFDNMAYSLKIAKLSKAEIKERVDNAAQLLQLSEYLNRKPRQLSGGQRQRVAMGRAIVRKPDVFLFDEPLSNLDAKLRVQMRLEIKKLQRDLGVTSVYVTHDQVEAMTLGDRLMVLNGGYVEQFGSPIDLYERPASLFVAEFIGSPSMNIIDGNVSEGVVELINGVRLPISVSATGAVKVGIRPEHMAADTSGEIAIVKGVAEQLGSSTLVHGSLEGCSSTISVALPGVHREEQLDDVMRFRVAEQGLHVFSADGKRVT